VSSTTPGGRTARRRKAIPCRPDATHDPTPAAPPRDGRGGDDAVRLVGAPPARGVHDRRGAARDRRVRDRTRPRPGGGVPRRLRRRRPGGHRPDQLRADHLRRHRVRRRHERALHVAAPGQHRHGAARRRAPGHRDAGAGKLHSGHRQPARLLHRAGRCSARMARRWA
jgi:hypothetical protein